MIGEVNADESSIGAGPPVDPMAGGEQPIDDHIDFVTWDEYQDFADYSELASGCNPDLWLYRDRTTALLWRYMRLAVESARLPSLLGREFFRARVSPYSVQTFEDTVIFVHDVESCVLSLDAADKLLIAMLGMEQYTQEEAALSLRCTQRTIGRRYIDALDNLSEIFLKREILTALPEKSTNLTEACQESKTPEFFVSDSE
jgi:DNA-directed RNA polymerase specialized sigma24 family protein